jgi:D-serine deaminase-like pyridoxal phosphate-dependent protein
MDVISDRSMASRSRALCSIRDESENVWSFAEPVLLNVRTGAERTLELLESQIGRPLSEVETPVAILDLDRLEGNLQSLQSYADSHAIALWPHTKTHKSPEIGLRQLAIGASGLTVAKTGEAEVFHEAGVSRILVHYPPFGTDKWNRLARLAAEGLELTVAVDGLAPATGLSAALSRNGATAELLVEMDVGLHRTGQATPAGALRLAEQLSSLPAVEVAGISCYPGHCRGDAGTIRSRVEAVDALLRETRDAFTGAGIRCDRISGGSTPTRYLTHETCVNELRSGTYALLDRNDGPANAPGGLNGGLEGYALWVEVTVVSDAVPGQIVIDAGSKTFTSDTHLDDGHGVIVGWPDANLHTINEEHGYVDVSGIHDRPALGDHLQVIPNHACGCVNLHDGLLGVRNGIVERVVRVAARGLVR